MKKTIITLSLSAVLAGCFDDGENRFAPGSGEQIKINVNPENGSYVFNPIEEETTSKIFELANNPDWVTIDKQGNIFVNPQGSSYGGYTFDLIITTADSKVIRKILIVLDGFSSNFEGNTVPSFESVPISTTVKTNEPATIEVAAVDAENNFISYSLDYASALVPWVEIAPTSGKITVDAPTGSEGTYPITVIASDGISTSSTETSIVVETSLNDLIPDITNNIPSVADIPTIKAGTGKLTSYSVLATDKDDDKLTYTLVNKPEWVQVDFHTGLILITPEVEHIGSHNLNLIISDGHVDITKSFVIDVAYSMVPVNPEVENNAPVISEIAALTVHSGETLNYRVNATDKQGDAITFSSADKPDWVSISEDGIITATPNDAHFGNHVFTINATDGKLTSSAQIQVNVTYISIPAPVNVSVTNVEDNTRGLLIRWDDVPGATSYKLYKGGKELKTLTETIHEDVGNRLGVTYNFSVAACEGNRCGQPSEEVSGTTLTNELRVGLSNFDNSYNAGLNLNIWMQIATGQMFSGNQVFNKEIPTRTGSLFHDGVYRLNAVRSQPSTGQICNPVGYSYGTRLTSGNEDVEAIVDCSTPVILTVSTETTTIEAGSTNQSGQPVSANRQSDGAAIKTLGSSFIYESSDETVVTVNADGTLNGVGAGEASITVSGSNKYPANSTSYNVIVNNSTSYLLNKIDFGQNLLLETSNKYQMIASGKGFLVRGFPVAKEVDFGYPEMTFNIDLDGKVITYPVTCPSGIMPTTPSEGIDYTLDNSC